MAVNQYILTSFFLALWCFLHSALISNTVISLVQNKSGKYYRFYRLFFNIFSSTTFLLVLYYFNTLPAKMFFRWDGGWRFIQFGLIALSLYLFLAGARHYDALQFLGFRQLRSDSNHKMLNKSGRLEITGLHKIIRHPWYSGSILIIWTRNTDSSVFIQNIIMTSYLIIGTILEEQKLIQEFGQEYRDYQKKVSMLIPVKWIKSKLRF